MGRPRMDGILAGPDRRGLMTVQEMAAKCRFWFVTTMSIKR
jgi:hypothetical protein